MHHQFDVDRPDKTELQMTAEPEPKFLDPTLNPIIEETIDEDFDTLEIHSENTIPNRPTTELSPGQPSSILPPRQNANRIEGSFPTNCPPALCPAAINASGVSPLGRLSRTAHSLFTDVVPPETGCVLTNPTGQTRVRHQGFLRCPGASSTSSPRHVLNGEVSPSRYLRSSSRLKTPPLSAAPPPTPEEYRATHIPTASSSPLRINLPEPGVRSPTMRATTSLLHTSSSPMAKCHSPIFFTPLGMGTLRALAPGGSNASPPQQRRRFNVPSSAPPQDSSTPHSSLVRAHGSFPISEFSSPETISERSAVSPLPSSPQRPQSVQDGCSQGNTTSGSLRFGPVRNTSSRRCLMRRVADAHLRDGASDPELSLCIDMDTIPVDRRAGPYTAQPCNLTRPKFANTAFSSAHFPSSSRTLDYNHFDCLDHSPQFHQHANPGLYFFRPPSPHMAFEPLRHPFNAAPTGNAIPHPKTEPLAFAQESNNLLRTPNFNNGVVFLGCSLTSRSVAHQINDDTSPSL